MPLCLNTKEWFLRDGEIGDLMENGFWVSRLTLLMLQSGECGHRKGIKITKMGRIYAL